MVFILFCNLSKFLFLKIQVLIISIVIIFSYIQNDYIFHNIANFLLIVSPFSVFCFSLVHCSYFLWYFVIQSERWNLSNTKYKWFFLRWQSQSISFWHNCGFLYLTYVFESYLVGYFSLHWRQLKMWILIFEIILYARFQ